MVIADVANHSRHVLQCSFVCYRIKALLDWVGDSAHAAIQKWSNANAQNGTSNDGVPDRTQASSARLSPVSIPAPAVAHVHAVAAILWKSKEMGDNFITKDMVSKELLRYILFLLLLCVLLVYYNASCHVEP
jgi:Baculoviral IAP repeat-containing protein 6